MINSFQLGSEFLVILVMLLLNAVLAAFEMALASISRARLVALNKSKKHGAQAALILKDNMENSLAVLQLGITLVGSLAAATGGFASAETLQPFFEKSFGISKGLSEFLAVITFVLPLSLVTMVFAELIPKLVGLQNREIVCLSLAPLMHRLAQIVSPGIRQLERLTKVALEWTQRLAHRRGASHVTQDTAMHELHTAVSMARTARLIGAHEEKILMSAAQLSVRPIRDIILPASDISMLPIQATLTDALLQAHLDMHTRFPVTALADDPQKIEGYVTFKDIVVTLKMNPSAPSLRAIVRPIKRLNEKEPIARILEKMIHDKIHIALIESDQHDVLGLVTMEDILEELVGNIEDEFDRLPAHIHPTEAGWIMGGGVHMDVVASVIGVTLPNTTHANGRPLLLAEWCTARLERPLAKGETVTLDGLKILVRKLRRRQLAEAFVRT